MDPSQFVAIVTEHVGKKYDGHGLNPWETAQPLRRIAQLLESSPGSKTLNTISDLLQRAHDVILSAAENLAGNINGENMQTLERTATRNRFLSRVLNSTIEIIAREDRDVSRKSEPSLNFSFGLIISGAAVGELEQEADRFLTAMASKSNPKAIWISIHNFDQYVEKWITDYLHPAAIMLAEVQHQPLANYVEVRFRNEVSAVISQATTQQINGLLLKAREQLSDINQTKKDATQATAEIGNTALTEAFEAARKAADESASTWTRYVFLLVAAGISLPLWMLTSDGTPVPHMAVTAILLKVALGLPVFALAAFSGHIAAQYRETARHLAMLTAQLQTVRAYSAELPVQERNDLFMVLGNRAFSDPGFLIKDHGKIGVAPDQLVELVRKALDTVTASQKASPN